MKGSGIAREDYGDIMGGEEDGRRRWKGVVEKGGEKRGKIWQIVEPGCFEGKEEREGNVTGVKERKSGTEMRETEEAGVRGES